MAPDLDNPHHSGLTRPHGYVRVELDAETWRSAYRVVETVTSPVSAASTATSWEVKHYKPGAVPVPAV